MDDSNSSEPNSDDQNPDDFPKPEIPPNSTPELVTLADNMNDLIQTIHKMRRKTHGPIPADRYVTILLGITQLFQQCSQLETIACNATKAIADSEGSPKSVRAMAAEDHDIVHVLADASSNTLNRLVEYFASTTEFSGFDKDIETLLKRIKTDWNDKGHI